MATSRVRLFCEIAYEGKERFGLAPEQSAGDETFDRHHGAEGLRRGRNRTNDRAARQLSADEGAWLRHDQIIEKKLSHRLLSKVREGQSIGGVSQGRRVARPVLPGLKVHGLARADTQQDS